MLKVFGSPLSQPTRAVLWTCKLLDIPYDFVTVDVGKGDHITEDFKKMNPNAKFPVLKDQDLVLWESHAIMRYLVNKYDSGSNGTLYPSDPAARAKVDAWLDWKHSYLRIGGAGVVRRRVMKNLMKDYSKHSMRFDFDEIPESREARILTESLNTMNEQLKSSLYIAGQQMTLADVALATEVEQLMMLPAGDPPPFGRDIGKTYSKVAEWQTKMRQEKGFKETHENLLKACVGIDKMREKAKTKAKM